MSTEDGSLAMVADTLLEDVRSPDIVLVPGGVGEVAIREDERVLRWLRAAHETSVYTASVCTGSLILAAAGILDGVPATTHWLGMDALAALGAAPRRRTRVVESGKIFTAAGVSSGIDMALLLAARIAGDDVASQRIQLSIEYDPQPPFDSPARRTRPPTMSSPTARRRSRFSR